MSADRDRLAAALAEVLVSVTIQRNPPPGTPGYSGWIQNPRLLADQVMNTVQALVAEGAAAELRAAAAAWTDFRLASDQLRARADALTAGSESGT